MSTETEQAPETTFEQPERPPVVMVKQKRQKAHEDGSLAFDLQGNPVLEEIEVACREIKLTIPLEVPDSQVKAAWELGSAIVQNAQSGILTMAFPHVRPGPDGKPKTTIGRKDVILAQPKDVERMLHLGHAITEINVAAITHAKNNPIDALTVTKNAVTMKDNTTADLVAQARGNAGGIILAG